MWMIINTFINVFAYIEIALLMTLHNTNEWLTLWRSYSILAKLFQPQGVRGAVGTALPSVSSQGKEACCCQWLRVTNPLNFLFTTFGTPSKLTIAKSIFLCIDHFGEHFSGTLTFHFPKDMSRSCLMQGSGTDWIKGNLHGLTPFKGTKLSTNSSCLLFCFCENKDAEP